MIVLCHAQGLEAISWIELSLLSKYFFHQLWNVLFVAVFARTLIYDILQNPPQLIDTLGQMLPKSSTTIANYVILQGTAIYPAQLLLAGPLVLTWLSRFVSWTKSTPRQISDAYYPSILTCINYGVVYPVPLLIFVIGLTYASIAPIILPFCTLFFAMGYFVYKYMLLYVHIPKYETRGAAATSVVNRCLVGVGIMQLSMMGVLALRAGEGTKHVLQDTKPAWSGYAQMVIGVLPLLVITVFVYGMLNQGYKRQVNNIPFDILGVVARDLASKKGSSTEQKNSRLQNPAENGQELRNMTGGENLRTSQTVRHRYSAMNMFGRQKSNEPIHQLPDEYNVSQTSLSVIEEPFMHLDPDENSPSENTALLEDNTSLSDFEEALALANHLEPPMTRVPGILDAPLGAAMLRHGDQDERTFFSDQETRQSHDDPFMDDLQIHTYLHPCLIGDFY